MRHSGFAKQKDTRLKTSEIFCLLTEFKMSLGFHSIIKMAETRRERAIRYKLKYIPLAVNTGTEKILFNI